MLFFLHSGQRDFERRIARINMTASPTLSAVIKKHDALLRLRSGRRCQEMTDSVANSAGVCLVFACPA
ncbi:MAG: hypothetical protein EBY28_16935 [Betaproteobacteria bacterium]|nr:hypothetical protein [Betaproteobacteria bacterium]